MDYPNIVYVGIKQKNKMLWLICLFYFHTEEGGGGGVALGFQRRLPPLAHALQAPDCGGAVSCIVVHAAGVVVVGKGFGFLPIAIIHRIKNPLLH